MNTSNRSSRIIPRKQPRKTRERRRRYTAPTILFDEPLTVQCGVCTGGPFKSAPACDLPNS